MTDVIPNVTQTFLRLLPQAYAEAGGKQPSIQTCVVECGSSCCKGATGNIGFTDTRKIRKQANEQGLVIKLRPTMRLFDNQWALRFSDHNDQCPFLSNVGYCGIYEDRPDACRLYPHKPQQGCAVYPGGPDDPVVSGKR